MKKISLLFVSILALSVAFTGCKKDADPATKKVSKVSIADVTKVDGQKVTQKEKITTPEQFEEVVLGALTNEFSGMFGEDDSVVTPSTIARAAAKDITIKDLEEAFNELTQQFKEIDDNASTINIDWTGPTGNLVLAGEDEKTIDGVSVNISGLRVKINASNNLTSTSETVSGNATAYGEGSIAIDSKAGLPVIQNAKVNAKVSAKISKFNATKDNTGVSKASGSAYGYSGVSGAVLFDVEGSDGKAYNGVVASNSSISIDTAIDKAGLEKLLKIFSEDYEPTDEELDALPVKIDIKVSVYDVNGNKLFDYIEFTKLSDLIKKF